MIESENLAKTALAEISELKLLDLGGVAGEEKVAKEVVHVPVSFILNQRFGPQMVSTSSDGAFDLYLAMLYLSQKDPKQPQPKVVLDYQELSKHFGDLEKIGVPRYRRAVQKELEKLEGKYKLIKWDRKHGENPEITLLNLQDGQNLIKLSKQATITIPKTYWDYGYAKTLSLTAKFMYLVSLHQATISPIRPWWSLSQEELEKLYHVKRWTFSTGARELKLENLLEIENSRTDEDDGDLSMRQPNRYKLNDLPSEQEKKQTLDALTQKHGEFNFQEAKRMAKDLDEPNDPLVIQGLLELIEIYDLQKVSEAVAIPAAFKPDNSQKHIRFVIGILQKQEQAGQ